MSQNTGGGEDTVVRTSFVRVAAEARHSGVSRYTMSELENLSGLSSRTIRFYIQEGLISSAYGRGPSATYDRDHLLRLSRIVELKAEVTALDQIKDRLEGLTTSDLEAHFAVRSGPEEERWRRVRVHPQLELHVREPGGDRDYRFEQALDQIIQHARIVLEHFENERP